jgi:hypothetical protein
MSDGQHLGASGALGGLSELALDFPRAFDVLVEIMRITPDFDPYVGYGALQGPKLWCELAPTEEQGTALLTLANDDPYLVYLLLKAYSFGFYDRGREQFLALDLGKRPMETALRFVRSKLGRRWGGPELTRRVRNYRNDRQ